MATLEKIRNKAGLLVAVVGLALFAFIIGDLFRSGSSIMNRNQNNIIVVNGKAIGYQDYMIRESELTEFYKFQMGSNNLSEMYMNQIRQSVYEEFVMENIVDPRLEELGIVVTTQEMLDMTEGENISPVLLQVPWFQNSETGMFNRNALLELLNQIKNIDTYSADDQRQLLPFKNVWMIWEKNIKRNRLNEKYVSLLTKAVVANSLDAKDAFNNSSVSSDIFYAMESTASTPDSTIIISNAEIEKLYNERKEMFRQQEAAVIDYIAVDILPSQNDYDQASKEIDAIRAELETTDNVAALVNEKSERKFINAFFSINRFAADQEAIDFVTTAAVGDIDGPVFKDNQYRILKLVEKAENADSVFVSILTVAPRTTEAETRIYADSILNVIKGGADFAELVLKHSVDQFVESGGELGWVTELDALQGINEEFRRTAFSLPTGQSAIVKSNGGLHIIKISDRTKNVPKYKVADIVYMVTPSTATRNQLKNDLNKFIAINNSIEKIEKNAKDNGYNLISNVRVYNMDMTVGTVAGARSVVRWAFNSKKGQVSEEPFECENAFVVATFRGKLREGYQSIASVEPQLKAELASIKKAEQIAADLRSRNLSSIISYADVMNTIPDTVRYITLATQRITNIGIEPKLSAFISFAPLNTVSEPIAGNNGVYVFEVINRTVDDVEYDESSQIGMIEANNAYRIGSLAFTYMRQHAKIEDNRIRFY